MTVLGALLGAAMGLILGTYVPPNRINVTFALVLTPLLFTGSSQYPWPSLAHIRWFQVVSAANPMTYVSEGLRGLMAPSVPHIPDVDLLRGGRRLAGGAGRSGHGWIPAAGDRVDGWPPVARERNRRMQRRGRLGGATVSADEQARRSRSTSCG